jgi:hypothetical protein
LDLLNKIKEEYELCINKPHEYKERVDSVSHLLGLKGKYKLFSEHCPVYFVGNYNQANIIFFGLNPGHSDTNSPIEDKQARISWDRYQQLYRNFFAYFEMMGFESPYYTSLWYLLTGLTSNPFEHRISDKWKFFSSYLTNMELIPYHSRGIVLPRILNDYQLNYLTKRLYENINFITHFKPKLFIFNGSTWYTILIGNGIITDFEKISITDKFNLLFFKINDVPCVLFNKFIQKHFWGITNEHRRKTIPALIKEKHPSIAYN